MPFRPPPGHTRASPDLPSTEEEYPSGSIRVPVEWVREQVGLYETSGGAEGTLLFAAGPPVITVAIPATRRAPSNRPTRTTSSEPR